MAIDVHIEPPSWISRVLKHFNFFRTHLLVFTITPLVFACIFYAANGSASGNANSTDLGVQKVYFIDSLFLCYSAMTVTGLVTVNVSALHPFQQVLLVILMIAGDYSVVSLVVVMVRKRFFRQHCFELLRADHFKRTNTIMERKNTIFDRAFTMSGNNNNNGVDKRRSTMTKLGPISGPRDARPIVDFVEERQHRVSLDNGSDHLPSPRSIGFPITALRTSVQHPSPFLGPDDVFSGPHGVDPLETLPESDPVSSKESNPESSASSSGVGRDESPPRPPQGILHHETMHQSPPRSSSQWEAPLLHDKTLRQERTIRLAEPPVPDSPAAIRQRIRHHSRAMSMSEPGTAVGRPIPNRLELFNAATLPIDSDDRDRDRRPSSIRQLPLSATRSIPALDDGMYTGFGGLPNPIQMLGQLIPMKTREQLHRALTRDEKRLTIISTRDERHDGERGSLGDRLHTAEEEVGSWLRVKSAKWMPESLGNLVIGRNSRFFTEELDDEALEQLGGVEYRSLRLLSWLVFGYILAFQLIPFIILVIYFSQIGFWDQAFEATPGVQAATVSKEWFSLIQIVASYTGSGFTLVDQSMLPLVTCYILVYLMDIAQIAGNHALPMTLRLVIWTGTKIFRRGDVHESLHFLLDHPRRCFLYLFPSHQTWYLVLAFFTFTGVEMFSFLVLNIGLPVLDDLPSAWEKFSGALLQSLSVRAAGFGVVAVPELAPATLFIYVILMYVAIYPIAMSVRATNVYEERALGVYHEEQAEQVVEPEFKGRRREAFGHYLSWHMRRQLAFDIWPVTIAIWLICIVERGKILNPDTSSWFTVFRIIFECVSGYSTIGLSMGTPNNNYSFSGELSTVSKLIVIFVMLRGRHRGLPVAIDRAILLPHEYARIDRRNSSNPTPITPRPFTALDSLRSGSMAHRGSSVAFGFGNVGTPSPNVNGTGNGNGVGSGSGGGGGSGSGGGGRGGGTFVLPSSPRRASGAGALGLGGMGGQVTTEPIEMSERERDKDV